MIVRDTLSHSIGKWLFEGLVQIPVGDHGGAITGWLDAVGNPSFLYGEITGYYLTCASFAGATESGGVARERTLNGRVTSAEEWLHGIWSKPPPATRHYLGASSQDWRNDGVFTFDCAMMVRGLSARETASNAATRRAIMLQLAEHIDPDGTLASHVPRTSGAALFPERWSTRTGPFLLKAAAAILCAPDVPPTVRGAAEATAARWRDWYASHDIDGDLHPLLYHLEGLYLLSLSHRRPQPVAWEILEDVYIKILSRQRDDGSLPRSLSDADSLPRADVMAQALRMGCLLINNGRLAAPMWRERLSRLATNLEAFVEPSGGVRFERRPGGPVHLNVWCAVFAYQAFVLYDRICRGIRIDSKVLRSIA
ncbi:MAG: hypothetical protein M3Y27_22635 [Acidobacteriota bacterium]|nr:hypothetical protein [Acidobacteriota bacterium]